jgi:hypothetical protein
MVSLLAASCSTFSFGNRDTAVLLIIEAGLFLAAAVLASLWAVFPDGVYEPFLAATLVAGGGIELLRRCVDGRRNTVAPEPTNSQRLAATIRGSIDSAQLSTLLSQSLELVKNTTDSSFEQWIRLELYGYSNVGGMSEADIVPEYRDVPCRHMDAQGRVVNFGSQYGFLNSHRFRCGVRQLEELAAKNQPVRLQDLTAVEFIRANLNVAVDRLEIHHSELVVVLDRIRNIFREKLAQHLSEEEAKTARRRWRWS